MTQDEIIRMAREAGFDVEPYLLVDAKMDRLERFAALVASHEAEKWKAENKRDYENWKMAAEKAAECEREACAKVCDDALSDNQRNKMYSDGKLELAVFEGAILQARKCAAAIRARGETK